MHMLLLVAPKYLEWPAKLGEVFMRTDPAFRITTVASNDYAAGYWRNCAAARGLNMTRTDNFADLERAWMRAPLDEDRLRFYQETLGTDVLRRILVSDRNLGSGYVTGAETFDNDLARYARDPDHVRNYIVRLLDYLFEIFEKDRPDFVHLYVVAGIQALAMAAVARHFGVPVYVLQYSRVQFRYFVDTSEYFMLREITGAYKGGAKNKDALAPWMDRARAYLDEFRASSDKIPDTEKTVRAWRRKKYHPVNVVRVVLQESVREILYPLRYGARPVRGERPVRRILSYIKTPWRAWRTMNRDDYVTERDLQGKKFIYFPLHVNPEASTMVTSPYHTNQFAVIEAISKQMPLDTDLVVKEHPSFVGSRPLDFYRQVAALPSVRLAHPMENSMALIKMSLLNITITGTVAWESLLLQRPAITIGPSPFTEVKGSILPCPDLTQIGGAIAAALKTSPASDDDLLRFLACIYARSFDFPTELFWGGVDAKLTDAHEEIAVHIFEQIMALMSRDNPAALAALKAA